MRNPKLVIYFYNFGKMIKNIYFQIGFVLLFTINAYSQHSNLTKPDSLISCTRELIKEAGTFALITLDKTGHPKARILDSFAPENDIIISLVTNKISSANLLSIGYIKSLDPYFHEIIFPRIK